MAALSDSDLTEEQKRCIDTGVKWWKRGQREGFHGRNQFFKIGGPAGTGKSATGSFLLEAIGFYPGSDDVAPIAPTGKAALVMRSKGIPHARTAHSGIYSPAEDAAEQIDFLRARISEMKGGMAGVRGEERERRKAEILQAEAELKELRRQEGDELKWTVNPQSPVARAKVAICDEAGMVGGQLKRDLESFGTPIIYSGDPYQLKPIDDDGESVFFTAAGAPLPADFTLTQIHRQAEGSAIIRYSRDIRENRPGQFFYGKETGEDGSVVLRVKGGRLSMDQMARAEQIICGFNNTRVRVNGEVREFLGRRTPYPEPGDKLICLRNNKDLNLINGMMGRALSAYSEFEGRNGSFKVDVELDDGREMLGLRMVTPFFQYPGDREAIYGIPAWSRKRHAHFDYGYAVSCHKFQGSSARGGVVLEEGFGRTPDEKRRWRYTAATRFEKFLIAEA